MVRAIGGTSKGVNWQRITAGDVAKFRGLRWFVEKQNAGYRQCKSASSSLLPHPPSRTLNASECEVAVEPRKYFMICS